MDARIRLCYWFIHHQKIKCEIGTRGRFITKIDGKEKRGSTLEYAIEDSLKILKYIYYSQNVIHLSRKFQKAKPYFKRT